MLQSPRSLGKRIEKSFAETALELERDAEVEPFSVVFHTSDHSGIPASGIPMVGQF